MKNKKKTSKKTVNNSLVTKEVKNTANNGLTSALGMDYCGSGMQGTIINSVDYSFLTLNWTVLANVYNKNGFIKTAVDLPVSDCFRNSGFELESGTLNAEELQELQETIIEKDLDVIKQTLRWGRLFGGGVILCNTNQKLEAPFNPETIRNEAVEFLACDRWQCYPESGSLYMAKTFTLQDFNLKDVQGVTIDASRLKTYTGEVQPYYIRNQLGGFGTSILESVIPQLDAYLKANKVILELLDEAKIDILKIFDLASVLSSQNGESLIKRRVQLFSEQKNYKSVGVIDSQDDYEQKTMTYSGLNEMLEKIFLLICSSIRIPYSKVFGRGASGFSSGEDDLENYNAMIMSEIRQPVTPIIKWVAQIRACQLFGRKVDDLSVKWKPLRVLSEKEEQEAKTQKINAYVQLLQAGVLTRKQVAEQLQKDDVMAFSEKELKELEKDFDVEDVETEEQEEIVNKKQSIGDKFKGMFKKNGK